MAVNNTYNFLLKKYIAFIIIFLLSNNISSQNSGVNIRPNTPHASSILDLSNNSNKALLLPRVALNSLTDITTIDNPAKDLIVYSTIDAGTGNNKVEANNIYKFNGSRWVRLTVLSKFQSKYDLPKVIAAGFNISQKNLSSNNVTSKSIQNFDFTTKIDPLNVLTSSGGFKAPYDGFYSFAIRAGLYLNQNPSQSFTFSPFLRNKDLTLFSFKLRGNKPEENLFGATGSIYLKQGESVEGFQWSPGENTIIPSGYIANQNIIWTYLGNPTEYKP